MRQWTVLFFAGLLLIGFIPNAMSQAGGAFSMSFTNGQVNLDVRPGANGTACTELVISNEGSETIDVEGNTTESNLVISISPSNFSVTLEPGESVTSPICITAAIGSPYRNLQVTTRASAKSQEGDNVVNKNAGFAAIIEQYAEIMVSSDSPYREVCELNDTRSYFTVFNLGNYVDTIAFEVLNQGALESSGFIISIPAVQALIDSNSSGIFSMYVSTPAFNVSGNNDYTINFQAVTTLQGETVAHNATVIYRVLSCTTEEDDSLPAISLIPALISIGLIAIFRRK